MHSSNPNSINNHIGMIFLALVLAVLFISEGISKTEFPIENTEIYLSNLEEFAKIVNDDTANTYSEDNSNYKIIKPNEFEGNVVIFSLTTTWCPHCPSVLIALDRLRKILQEQGVTNVKILSLNVGDESREKVKEYFEANGVPGVFDEYKSISSNVLQALSLNSFPVCIVFGMNGEFLGCHVGVEDYISEEFVKYIKEISGHDENYEFHESVKYPQEISKQGENRALYNSTKDMKKGSAHAKNKGRRISADNPIINRG